MYISLNFINKYTIHFDTISIKLTVIFANKKFATSELGYLPASTALFHDFNNNLSNGEVQ